MTPPASHHGGHVVPAGLAASFDGYTVDPASSIVAASSLDELVFEITDPHGARLRDYVPMHGRDLHLVVVGRDLTGYQHLHPELQPDGTWRVPLWLPAPGSYRAFADFTPPGRGEPVTLGFDLLSPGDYRPTPLAPPSTVAHVDEYTVRLSSEAGPSSETPLSLFVEAGGKPVTDLEPHLGAFGHLVAVRAGDLAYVHVHPTGTPDDGATPAGPHVGFHLSLPTRGSYGLFFDFKHAGTVRTAAFTVLAEYP